MIEVGKKYDMLMVVEDLGQLPAGNRSRHFYLCECECGKRLPIRSDQLGHIHSCGCIKKITSAQNAERNHKHKQSGTRLYRIWQQMLGRCRNPRNKRYDRYGGRGISVSDEWQTDFTAFQNWALANGYNEHLTIDRIDNDGDYTPSNCRWTDNRTQARNRSTNVHIGDKLMCDVAKEADMCSSAISARIRRGDTGDSLVRPKGAPTGKKRGENNNKAKITDADALEIKKLLRAGVPQTEIAHRFNVSKYLIFDIKRGRTWTHIHIDDTEVNG